MYQIRYKDPMTGKVLEVQAQSLTEAVNAIQKVKDDFYYRGHTFSEPEVDPPAEEDAALHEAPEHEEETDNHHDKDHEEEYDLDDFLYPYGVTLW